MAKKIEGWAWPDTGDDRNRTGSPIYYVDVPGTVNATLVIHEGKPERVLTESEVRAMVLDLIEDQARCDVHNGWQSGVIPDFAGIATKHGITLDPTEPK